MTRALGLVLVLSGCVDIPSAHDQFCVARPELCCPGSDDFGRPALGPCWQNLEPTAIEPRPLLQNGKLVVEQRPNWNWSSGQRGFLLYQTLTGNFVAETSARLRQLDGGAGFSNFYTAAALIAFHPGTNGASHLVSVGTIGNSDISGVLTEFTNDAGVTTTPRDQPGTGFAADLRLCRVGNSVTTYFREPDSGAGWRQLPQVFDPDGGIAVPETLFVGPGAYQVGGVGNARAEFDYFSVRTGLAAFSQCGDEL